MSVNLDPQEYAMANAIAELNHAQQSLMRAKEALSRASLIIQSEAVLDMAHKISTIIIEIREKE